MEKQRWKESEKRKSQRKSRKKIRRETVRRKKMQVRKKAKKSRNTAFWPCFVAPEGRKVGSLKRPARSHLGRWEIKKLHAVVVRSRFRSQNAKTPQCRSTFGSSDVPKVRTVVGRSTFRSKNVLKKQERSSKLRCGKSALPCGAKQIWESKLAKHTRFGAPLQVEMWKKCTQLWRKAHFQVKVRKKLQLRITCGSSDIEEVHAVVARSTFRS